MALGTQLPLGAMSRLAWRNLWRNHRRTLIMLLAITVGAWAMIFMTALMRGMVEQMVIDGVRNLPGLVQVHHPDFRDDPSIGNSMPEPKGEFLAALSGTGASGWTSRVRVPAMISSERDNRGVTLLGVDPAGEIAVGFDPDSIVAGRFLQSPNDTGLVVGRKMLELLETDLGKRVVIMSQDPDNDIADRGFRIVGVFKGTLSTLEENFVYAGRGTVQSLLAFEGRVSEIAVAGPDFDEAESMRDRIRQEAPPDHEVLAWGEIDRFLKLSRDAMSGMVLIFVAVIFLALSFGLVNTLMMAVFERIREIGLMQALGMRPSAILYQVLIESVLLLLCGLGLGNVLALWSIWAIRDGIDISMVAEGMEMMGASSMLYPALTTPDFIMANLTVIVLGIITSLIPAWRASRYRPVEAIAKL